MNLRRRSFHGRAAVAMLAPLACTIYAADSPLLIRLNLPGPHSLPFLPVELIPLLGIDREFGATLNLRYFTSGVLAFEDMMAGNAPFAGHGFFILPGMHKKGKSAVAITSIAGTNAALSLLVRADLASKIKRVADLKSRSIGASSGSINSKTYLQMIGETVLGEHGVGPGEVRWVNTAQNWESIRSVLESKSVDAVLCEEPFATRAVSLGLARFLVGAGDMSKSRNQIGGKHLRSIISTPAGSRRHEQETRVLTQMLQRSLQWVARARRQEIVAKLPFETAAQATEMLGILQRYPDIFSPDGRFSVAALAASASMLKRMGSIEQVADVDGMVDDRWVGRAP